MISNFGRREWGAATFIVTVLVGLIAVPVALAFGHQGTPLYSPSLSNPAASTASMASTASSAP